MAQMTSWVHQYTLRDLLDESFDLFKERATTFLLVAVLPYTLVAIYLVIMRLYVLPGTFAPIAMDEFAVASSPEEFWDILTQNMPYLSFLLGLLLVGMATTVISYLAQCRIALRHALGETATIGDAFGALPVPLAISLLYILLLPVASIPFGLIMAIGVFAVYIATVLAAAIGFAFGSLIGPEVGAILAGILGLVVAIASGSLVTYGFATFFIAAPSSLVMREGIFVPFRKSFRIATSNFKAHFWSLFLVAHIPLIFNLLLLIVVSVATFSMNFVSPSTATVLITVFGGLGNLIGFGFFACLQALVYIDGGCRRDNLDLRLLAQQIGLEQEVTQASQAPPAVAAQSLYPDYTAVPLTAGMPATVGSAQSAFPDYSAPPPPIEAANSAQEPGGHDAS